jgi:hypothetical protein
MDSRKIMGGFSLAGQIEEHENVIVGQKEKDYNLFRKRELT